MLAEIITPRVVMTDWLYSAEHHRIYFEECGILHSSGSPLTTFFSYCSSQYCPITAELHMEFPVMLIEKYI